MRNIPDQKVPKMAEIRKLGADRSGSDAGPPGPIMPRRLAAIVAGDICGYSRLMQIEGHTHPRDYSRPRRAELPAVAGGRSCFRPPPRLDPQANPGCPPVVDNPRRRMFFAALTSASAGVPHEVQT